MSKLKYDLPKEYFSYSQARLWHKSPESYLENYIKGQPYFVNKSMKYGSYIGKAIETQNFFELLSDERRAVWQLPSFEDYEKEISFYVDGVRIKGYIDGYTKGIVGERSHIGEFKTGKTPWTEDRVANANQLLTYAYAEAIETDVIPDVSLYWMPTETNQDSSYGVRLTGECHEFKRVVTDKDFEGLEEWYRVALEGVTQLMYNYKNNIVPDLDYSRLDRIEQLVLAIKDSEQELSYLKKITAQDFETNNVNSWRGRNGSFWLKNGKIWYRRKVT